MNKATVVMLGYKSQAGKDTVYSFAKDLGFKRVAFADSLKHICMNLFNLSEDQVFGNQKDEMDERFPNTRDSVEIVTEAKNKDLIPASAGLVYHDVQSGTVRYTNPDYKPYLTPRRILQLFGQDCRSLYSNVWASYIFNVTIPELLLQGHNKIMITDFRFKNEARVAKEWAEKTNNRLYLYEVVRPGICAKSGANDISENELNDFGGWYGSVINDSSLDDLKSKTISMFSSI